MSKNGWGPLPRSWISAFLQKHRHPPSHFPEKSQKSSVIPVICGNLFVGKSISNLKFSWTWWEIQNQAENQRCMLPCAILAEMSLFSCLNCWSFEVYQAGLLDRHLEVVPEMALPSLGRAVSWSMHGGFSWKWGYPIAGWFLRGKMPSRNGW